jgi:glycosyltransferase involved in cell wall biosynthesis
VLEAAAERGIPSILSIHDFWWLCERQFMIRPDQRYCGQNPVRIEGCRGCVGNFEAASDRFSRLREIGRLPARVTYPSRFAYDLSVASGFAPETGVVWENGVRLPGPAFAQAQTARRAKDATLTFGFVGGPSQIKGWPQIKAAFAALKNTDFRVIVVDGSMDGSWWRDQNLSALPGEWVIHPRFSQQGMDVFYEKIDILLFMSQWKETFGLAIREALARGIDVIQTDSGGTTEHGAVPADQLIPIDAPAAVLGDRIRAALAAHPAYRAPHPVIGYDAQASAFDALTGTVLDEAG